MEQRLANTWKMTVNERKFIETAMRSDLRIDGRRPFDYRELTIKFGREDGSSEVHLGQTRVLGFVTSQLVQPYRDRPNEGSLSIFTEFSPMADPSFEAGRPGESAVELGRIVDRGLRESRAIDTESLCVVSGKFVWSIRIDLHILDNGGNLVDAANIAALAALLTFRRPECTVEGEDGREVIVHPPEVVDYGEFPVYTGIKLSMALIDMIIIFEVREPLPLIIHHLPIAVTFAFFGEESMVVIDPTHFEEAVMGGKMTATLNTNGDVCAIQKAGGAGLMQSVIMQCLRIASVKAGDITTKIKEAVDSYNTERALRKIKRHPAVAAIDVGEPSDFSREKMGKIELKSSECGINNNGDMDVDIQSPKQERTNQRDSKTKSSIGALSSWDPYSEGINADELKVSLASRGGVPPVQNPERSTYQSEYDRGSEQLFAESNAAASSDEMGGTGLETKKNKTLEDAVKPKHRRKNK